MSSIKDFTKNYYLMNLEKYKFNTNIKATGFEPATPTTPSWCATGLRYAPKIISR